MAAKVEAESTPVTKTTSDGDVSTTTTLTNDKEENSQTSLVAQDKKPAEADTATALDDKSVPEMEASPASNKPASSDDSVAKQEEPKADVTKVEEEVPASSPADEKFIPQDKTTTEQEVKAPVVEPAESSRSGDLKPEVSVPVCRITKEELSSNHFSLLCSNPRSRTNSSRKIALLKTGLKKPFWRSFGKVLLTSRGKSWQIKMLMLYIPTLTTSQTTASVWSAMIKRRRRKPTRRRNICPSRCSKRRNRRNLSLATIRSKSTSLTIRTEVGGRTIPKPNRLWLKLVDWKFNFQLNVKC